MLYLLLHFILATQLGPFHDLYSTGEKTEKLKPGLPAAYVLYQNNITYGSKVPFYAIAMMRQLLCLASYICLFLLLCLLWDMRFQRLNDLLKTIHYVKKQKLNVIKLPGHRFDCSTALKDMP